MAYGTNENGGDGAWCKTVLDYIQGPDINLYSTEAKHQFEGEHYLYSFSRSFTDQRQLRCLGWPIGLVREYVDLSMLILELVADCMQSYGLGSKVGISNIRFRFEESLLTGW